MNKLALTFALTLSLFLGRASGQDAPAPKAPYVKTPPPGTSWSAEIRYRPEDLQAPTPPDGPASGAEARPRYKAQVSLPVRLRSFHSTNGIQHVETYFSDGRKEEYYQVAGRQLRFIDGTRKAVALSEVPHFPAVDWLPPGGVYKGVETLENVPCHAFTVSAAYLAAIPLDPATKYLAWINVETGYPVQVRQNEVLYKFSPVTPWAETITLPAEFLAAMEKVKKEQRAIQALRQANAR
jgi:hypothetical protein